MPQFLMFLQGVGLVLVTLAVSGLFGWILVESVEALAGRVGK